jgi:glycosyltransferase involved in cell wall biosynthesis
MKRLSERAEITLVCSQPVADPSVGEMAEIWPTPPADPRLWPSQLVRRWEDLRLALSRVPRELAESAPALACLKSSLAEVIVAKRRFDTIVLEHAPLAELVHQARGVLPPVGQPQPPRVVLTLHNVASERAFQTRSTQQGRRQRWLWARDAVASADFERRLMGLADRVVAVSPEDQLALPGPTYLVPNGVDCRQFQPGPLIAEPRLVFTGSLDYLPNIDGLEWFVGEVLPRIAVTVPEVTLLVAGRRPVERVGRLATDSRITVLGDVDSVPKILSQARVALVPLRIGSGTRLKALEALAAGRPVVGTGVGLAGLGIQPGVHALFADGVERFADATIRLLKDDSEAKRLADAGRSLAESYDWDRVAEQFLGLVLPNKSW